jgi:hypothetical protein
MLLKEQNQTIAINVTGNSTREFIVMSLGFVALIPRNDLATKISRRRSPSSRLWMQLLRQMGLVGNATTRTRATPRGNGASSSTRSTFFTARANTRRDFDPSH